MNKAEEFLLSALLKGDDKYRITILQELKPEWFVDDYARELFNATKSTYLGLTVEFNKNINLEKLAKIEEHLTYNFVSGATFQYYVELLKKYYKEELLKQSKKALIDAKDDIEYNNIFSEYMAKITELNNPVQYTKEFKDDMFQDFIDDYVIGMDRIMTGYKKLDEMLGGFFNGESTIIAGASSMGKSAFMLNLAVNIAKQNKKVLMFSLEMSRNQMFNRILCSEVGINLKKIRNRELCNDEIELMNKRYDEQLKQLPIIICDKANMRVQDMNAEIKKLNPDIVFIDYLGLVKPSKSSKKYEEITEISRDIKLMSKDNNLPIITGSQLSRISEDRRDKRPKLKDLKDSGAVENDADNVLGVYRDEYYNPETTDTGKIEIGILKQRQGAWGVVKLNFNAPIQKITE